MAFDAPDSLGIIVEVHRRSAKVRGDDGQDFDCAYSPVINLESFSNFAVGDRVTFHAGSSAQEPLITSVLPRTSKISRPGPRDRRHDELILAANVDALVIVSTPSQPDFNPRLIDRYLALAENFSIDAVICLNKIDLEPELPSELVYLKTLGYTVLTCSVRQRLGLQELQDHLAGRMVVLSGSSGVGKSSLIKALVPGADPRVGEVRDRDGRGRHTTTASQLYTLSNGLRIIDTPGIRELGFWGVESRDLSGLWRDFKALHGQCQFRDCMHRGEKGCAVAKAVAAGQIPEARLSSYRRILSGMEF